MTLQERMAVVETEMRNLKKMVWYVIISVFGIGGANLII